MNYEKAEVKCKHACVWLVVYVRIKAHMLRVMT